MSDWQRKFVHGLAASHQTGRMAIYRNNVVASLMTAIEDTFPIFARYVGESCFKQLAFQFVETYKPDHAVLADYGKQFPAFIKHQEGLTEYPYLSDLARLERLYIDAFHSADGDSIRIDEFQNLFAQPDFLPECRFVFRPDFNLFSAKFSVVSLWLEHQKQQEADLSGIQIDHPEFAFLIRRQHRVQLIRVTQSDWVALSKIQDGITLGDVIDQMAVIDQTWSFISLFQQMIHFECVSELRIDERGN